MSVAMLDVDLSANLMFGNLGHCEDQGEMVNALKNCNKVCVKKCKSVFKCLHLLDVIYGFYHCQGHVHFLSPGVLPSSSVPPCISVQKCPIKDTSSMCQSNCARKIR